MVSADPNWRHDSRRTEMGVPGDCSLPIRKLAGADVKKQRATTARSSFVLVLRNLETGGSS